MNAELLKDNLAFALDTEDDAGIGGKLDAFVEAFGNLTGNPTDPSLQTAFKASLTELRKAMFELEAELSNVDLGRLQSVRALDWMNVAFADKLQRTISENNMTPAVALSEIKATVEGRKKFFATLRGTNNGLKAIGIRGYGLVPGIPEISLLLPRDLFANQLSGLIKELRQISFIFRAIAAAVGQETEEIEIKSISTTDPQFFLSTTVQVAIAIASSITWGLNTLTQLEKLKQARAANKDTHAFSSEELDKIFLPKIQSIISEAIKELKEELLGKPQSNKHRELGAALENAATALLGRLERGVKVEIHFLPKKEPVENGEESGDPLMQVPKDQVKLLELAQQISYEDHETPPVLSITYAVEEAVGDEVPKKKIKPKEADKNEGQN
ncbi:hypothetical protein ACQKH5_11565 [Hyphomonas sp. NPDC076900]|uniref:hypothetical protein n=1 Tax=unclassified Hyphomonas TaxID=2630699 RepID=UPI003CFEE8FD